MCSANRRARIWLKGISKDQITKGCVCCWKEVFGIYFKDDSVQFSHSVMSNLCDSMDYSTPGLPVHHHLPEFTQTHVHLVGDAIQPSHPLSSPSSPTFNPSIRVFSNESVLHIRWPSFSLEFQLQHQWEPLNDGDLGSELTRLRFWKDLLTADGLWPSTTLYDTIYKCFNSFISTFSLYSG